MNPIGVPRPGEVSGADPPPTGNGRLHRNVWATSVTSFLTDVSSEMILNVLPLFLANVLGVRVWAVGVVEGVADTTAAVVKLYSGWLSDRLGARKWLAVTGYAISASVKPFYLLVTSWAGVAAIRFGDRVGKGVRTGPRDALLADSSRLERRGLVFGVHRAADTGGAALGLLITLWLVGRMQGDASLLGADTFRTLVVWSLLPAFVAVVVLALGARDVSPNEVHRNRRPDGHREGDSGRAKGVEGSGPKIRLRGLGSGFGWFVAASIVFELGNSADAFIVLRAQERGLSVFEILTVLLVFNLVYAVVAVPAGSISDRVGRKRVLLFAWAIYAASYLGFATAGTPTHVVFWYLIYAVYHGMSAGAAKALVADLVPEGMRGLAFGGYAAAVGLVSLPASVLGGVLWEGFGGWSGLGPAAPFAFGAAMAGVAAVVLAIRVPGGARNVRTGTTNDGG